MKLSKKRKTFIVSIAIAIIVVIIAGICTVSNLSLVNLKGVSYGGVSIKRNFVNASQFNDGNRNWQLYVKRMTPYLLYVAQAASKYNVDPALIMGIIMDESHADRNAVSFDGCCGLMQVVPMFSQNHTCKQLKNPRTAILDGTKLLKDNLKRWPKEQAICAYNQGSMPSKSCSYSERVLKYESIVKKLYTIKTTFKTTNVQTTRTTQAQATTLFTKGQVVNLTGYTSVYTFATSRYPKTKKLEAGTYYVYNINSKKGRIQLTTSKGKWLKCVGWVNISDIKY